MRVQILSTILGVIIKPLMPQTSYSFACDAIVESVDSCICLAAFTQKPFKLQICQPNIVTIHLQKQH